MFYKNRFMRVFVVYLYIAIPFFLWKSVAETPNYKFLHFFYDLSGLSFWFDGCQNAWFVEAIVLFYLLTPMFYKIITKGKFQAMILLFFIYVMNYLGLKFIPGYSHSAIAWTRLPVFIAGMALAYYPVSVPEKARNILTIISALVVLMVFIVPIARVVPRWWIWLFYIILVVPIIYVLAFVFEHLPKRINKIFDVFGRVSLEIYLVHIFILHIIVFYGFHERLGYWLFLLLPAISLPISCLIPKMTNSINKMVFNTKKIDVV